MTSTDTEPLLWVDPPTLDAKIEAIRERPGRWALLARRKTADAAAGVAKRLRLKHKGIRVLACKRCVYAMATPRGK